MQDRTTSAACREVVRSEPQTRENITVAVRFRDAKDSAQDAWHISSEGEIVLSEAARQKRKELGLPHHSSQPGPTKFAFDSVFDGHASTREVYRKSVQHIVHSTLDGVNGSVLAYGATGSGKTFTMVGDNVVAGVITMALADLFTEISKRSATHEYSISSTMIELYNEQITDLFDEDVPSFPCTSRSPIQIVVCFVF